MPRLSAYRDNDELDNAIADKTIVYVEGPDDVSFFTNLAGPDVRDRLEFKTPENGTGYHQVKTRVAELRPDNRKVHGLLDGEAAAALGQVDLFLKAQGELFQAETENLEGLVFLAEYELENLLLCHTKMAQFIVQDVVVAELGTRDPVQVQQTIDTLALRFFLFSLIKFTMIAFHSDEQPCKGIGTFKGRFLDPAVGAAQLMRCDVRPAISQQVDWEAFRDAMHGMVQTLRDHQAARGLDEIEKRREALRLADGKLMLVHVRSRYKGGRTWDGHLHGELAQSDYSGRFRNALLEATGTAQRAAA
jgi:hypothetical protein